MEEKVVIRHAVPGDETALAEIQAEAWEAAFSGILPDEKLKSHLDKQRIAQMYHYVLNETSAHGSLLLIDSQPHCMAFWDSYRGENHPDWAELICIHSRKGNWGRGYGSMMMEHILQEIKSAGFKQVGLWVFEQNIRARRFYEKHGFILTQERKNSFGADEVLYLKSL